jgi:hypothetical protein
MPLAHNRPATEADLPAAIDLFLAAVASMFARQHIAKPMPPRAGVELILPHILKTGIFHVAERDGQLVAICHAIVRDRVWFLSGFWTRPDLVGGGVGGPLLRDVWQAGTRAGAETFFVWSSPDETAFASYLKMGMLPGYPVLTFAARDVAQEAFAHDAYTVDPLQLDVACDIDETVRATRREVDHRFLLALPRVAARQVIRAGRAVGYFYVNGETAGPVAWLAPEYAEGVLAHACRTAAAGAGAITLRVPGINHDAIRFALARGLRFSGAHAYLLTTAPFGRLEQYLPSGPSLY